MSSNSTIPPFIIYTPADSSYGYLPTFYVCVIFIALFSLSSAIHLGQAVYFRIWYLIPTLALGGLGEVVGWSGRLWSNKNLFRYDAFLMQISSTIISPTFMSAANFVILGTIINRLGSQYSRLSSRNYAILFIVTDVAALTVQAVGGALASEADNSVDANRGGNIMLGGIVIQLVAIVIYAALAIEFVYRFNTNTPFRGRLTKQTASSASNTTVGGVKALDKKLKLMFVGLAISTLFLFIRAVYRTIELSNGWGGRIIRNQTYFNALDGAPITIVMFSLNFFHPGFLLRTPQMEKSYQDAENVEVPMEERS